MSTPQEEIKAIRTAYFPGKRTPEENKALCKKYPFLKWYGDPLYIGYNEENIDYDYTWEDELPDGWKIAFCPQIWDELKAILEKANYVNEFRFSQIKEKFGQLRLYHSGVPESIFEELMAWESKYESLSETVCINCGKPMQYMTLGWITFVCEDCAKASHSICVSKADIEAYYDENVAEKKKFIKKF